MYSRSLKRSVTRKRIKISSPNLSRHHMYCPLQIKHEAWILTAALTPRIQKYLPLFHFLELKTAVLRKASLLSFFFCKVIQWVTIPLMQCLAIPVQGGLRNMATPSCRRDFVTFMPGILRFHAASHCISNHLWSKLWSSQLWTQFKLLRIEAW